MTQRRPGIPKAISEQVLDEFNHLCAVCGGKRPQLHHIDKNPANNDPMNLIPLCPNDHLSDAHNPTQPIEPGKLSLLRRYKDPTVLTPQFHVLFIQVRFLDEIADNANTTELRDKSLELVEFVNELEMGNFYANQIKKLCKAPVGGVFVGAPPGSQGALEDKKKAEQRASEYRNQLRNARDEVYSLIVQLLRFQSWRVPQKKGD